MRDGRDERLAPRLALNKTEAAQALGVSVDFFDEHVAHELRCVRRGRRRLYPMWELERWLREASERAKCGLGSIAGVLSVCSGWFGGLPL